MQNLTYLAVFEPSTDGSYSIYFPDLPGCISVGDNLEEAARMAAEAASLHVYSMECDNEEIPTPSVNLSKEDTEGNVVMPVTIHPDLFRMKKDNERIKTNITLKTDFRRTRQKSVLSICGNKCKCTACKISKSPSMEVEHWLILCYT